MTADRIEKTVLLPVPIERAWQAIGDSAALGYKADEAFDPATDPLTHVELRLEEHGGGTRLTIVESGFMQVPEPRRAKAYEANAGGWEMQARLVARYLAL